MTVFIASIDGCIIKTTARKGLKVVCTTYCGKTLNAADGVDQIVLNKDICKTCRERAGVVL